MKRALNPIHRVSRAPLSSLRRRRGRAGGRGPRCGVHPARRARGACPRADAHRPAGRRPGDSRARPRRVRRAPGRRGRDRRPQRDEGLGDHPRDPHEGERLPRRRGGGRGRRAPRQPVDLRGDPGGRDGGGRGRGASRLHVQGDAVLVPDPLLRVPAATCRSPRASTSATSSSSGAGSPGPGSGATTGPSTSTARATRGRTRCAASRRRATSSRPRWARGPATTAGPGPSSRTSR